MSCIRFAFGSVCRKDHFSFIQRQCINFSAGFASVLRPTFTKTPRLGLTVHLQGNRQKAFERGLRVKINSNMDTSQVNEQFHRDGYYIMENFLTDEEVDLLRSEMATIISNLDPSEHRSVFSTTQQFNDDYFMTSGDKIRFFFEDGAIDKEGQLVVDKTKSVNKIGHALHCLSPAFRKITFSDKVKAAVKALGLEDPVVCQSMYIFKQPRIGGLVVPHQDSTFLFTTPQRLIGLWIALEDATLDNGCLWFIPGSHKDGVHGNRRMVRKDNPEPGTSQTEMVGAKVEYEDSKFVAGPVKKGTLVMIHGEVVHKSEHNYSDKSREIYTFHVYDHANCVYDHKNWLLPTEAGTFSHLYTEPATQP